MTDKIEFFRDDEGHARVRVQAKNRHRLLTVFLETDLQDDAAVVNELQRRIERVMREISASEEFIGNAHVVSLTRGMALLKSQFDAKTEPEKIPLSVFRDVVAEWFEFIETSA